MVRHKVPFILIINEEVSSENMVKLIFYPIDNSKFVIMKMKANIPTISIFDRINILIKMFLVCSKRFVHDLFKI